MKKFNEIINEGRFLTNKRILEYIKKLDKELDNLYSDMANWEVMSDESQDSGQKKHYDNMLKIGEKTAKKFEDALTLLKNVAKSYKYFD